MFKGQFNPTNFRVLFGLYSLSIPEIGLGESSLAKRAAQIRVEIFGRCWNRRLIRLHYQAFDERHL